MMFGAGDRQQVLNGGGVDSTGMQDGKAMKHSILAIRGKPVMERADRNGEMQIVQNRETNRFGDPHLSELKKNFDNLDDVTSAARSQTYWFPVFFEYDPGLCEWAWYTKNEITREPNVFVSVLTMLGLECVINSAVREREILVICYLNRVVTDLEAFLQRFLQPMCEYWHKRIFAKRRDPNYYAYWKLKQTVGLKVVGPINARGKTADIVFTVGMQRRDGDVDYSGMWSDPKMLQIHFTRVRRRIYTFVHDMTEGIRLHPTSTDALTQKVLNAGVPTSKKLSGDEDMKRANQSNLRRQLFYWQLKQQSRDIWHARYNCDFTVAGSKQANMSDYYMSLKDTLPFQRSAVYARLLRQDLQNTAERVDSRDCIGKGNCQRSAGPRPGTRRKDVSALPKSGLDP